MDVQAAKPVAGAAMRRVLMAWELGGNMGHVVPLLALARALRSRGHQVIFAMRDLANAGMLAREGFAFLPAPVPPRRRRPPVYGSFAEMLAGEAFPSANGSFVGALAWRSIFRAVRAEVLVADHAPLALLAARGTDLRTILFGAPFSIPPAGRPLPRFLKRAGDARAREAKLLERLNGVLGVLRGPKLEAASDLYRTDATAVKTVPELDFFGPRPQDHYVGPALADAGDAVPAWPKARGTKFAVYLRPGPHLLPLLDALERSRASVIAYVPNADAALAKAARDRGVHLSETPLKLTELLPQCDAVVCHGGNLSAAAVLAGKPLLMCPVYVEQHLAAAWTARRGLAVVAAAKPGAASFIERCEALRPGGEPSRQAAAFAKQHALHYRSLGVQEIVRKIEALHGKALA